MILTFLPVRMDESLVLHRRGEVLTVNGEALDLGPLPEGGSLPEGATGCRLVVGEVTREGGALRIALILPHGADAPPEALFPAPLTVGADGPVALPWARSLLSRDGRAAEGEPA